MATEAACSYLCGSIDSELRDLNTQADKLSRTIELKKLEVEELTETQKAIEACIAELEHQAR